METSFNWIGFLITIGVLFFATWIIILFVVSVKMANKRGRSGLGWFLFSLFFSPFLSMLFLALLGETDEKRLERIIEEENWKNRTLNKSSRGMKNCPRCAELIKVEAIVCRYCSNEKSNVDLVNSNNDFEEWKKNNTKGTLNEYYVYLKENNKTAAYVRPIAEFNDLDEENRDSKYESKIEEKEPLYISPITKVIIFGILIIAVSRYEYIGQKTKMAWKYVSEKTNLNEDPDGFNKTSFDSREEELKYIREYLKFKVGLYIEKAYIEAFRKNNSNPTKKEIDIAEKDAGFYKNILTVRIIEPMMNEIVRSNKSIADVKERLNNPEVQKMLNESIYGNKEIVKPKIIKQFKEESYKNESFDNEEPHMEIPSPESTDYNDDSLNEAQKSN